MAEVKEAYLRGRLEGLYQLVEILKDLVDTKGEKTDPMVRTIVLHVFEELGEILGNMKDGGMLPASSFKSATSTVTQAKKQVAAGAPVKPHVGAGKDLMKELMAASKKK